MEVILAYHPTLSTTWLDWVANGVNDDIRAQAPFEILFNMMQSNAFSGQHSHQYKFVHMCCRSQNIKGLIQQTTRMALLTDCTTPKQLTNTLLYWGIPCSGAHAICTVIELRLFCDISMGTAKPELIVEHIGGSAADRGDGAEAWSIWVRTCDGCVEETMARKREKEKLIQIERGEGAMEQKLEFRKGEERLGRGKMRLLCNCSRTSLLAKKLGDRRMAWANLGCLTARNMHYGLCWSLGCAVFSCSCLS